MPLDTDIERLLRKWGEEGSGAAPMDMARLRADTDAGLRQLQGSAPPVAFKQSFHVPTRDGYALPVVGYWPEACTSCDVPPPALVFAHGGGWCLGSADVYDAPCRALANATASVVLSVDYRLAPEHRYPVPLHDVFDALCHVLDNAGCLGLDPLRIGVAGDSAGGNLAAAACLMARDLGRGPVAYQLLIYPALSDAMDTWSYDEFGEGYYLTRDLMEFCFSTYLGDIRDEASPYVSPLLAPRLEGLPETAILTAEFDPLRGEAEVYGERLVAAGVKATVRQLDGMIHGCIHMNGVVPAAGEVFDVAGGLVKRAWSR